MALAMNPEMAENRSHRSVTQASCYKRRFRTVKDKILPLDLALPPFFALGFYSFNFFQVAEIAGIVVGWFRARNASHPSWSHFSRFTSHEV